MIEDKLTRPERLRLEALAQAIAFVAQNRIATDTPTILGIAEEFEVWLYKAAFDSPEAKEFPPTRST